MTPQRILVTDAHRGTGLATIRSLGRAGHEVVAAGTGDRPIGWASRYAGHLATYPDPMRSSAEATAVALLEIARRRQVDAILPVTDDAAVPLTDHLTEYPAPCPVLLPPPLAGQVAWSKAATTALARAEGAPVAASVLLTDPASAEAAIESLGSPVVAKPDRSRVIGEDGRLHKGEVRYCWTAEELAACVRAAGQPVLACSHHPGTGVGIGLVALDGEILTAVAHRRVHEVPVSGGASALRRTVPLDPGLLEHSARLIRTLGWTGPAMIEFKVGPRGPVLLEINGRLWGSVPLAVRAGCDIPALAVAAHLGTVTTADRRPHTGYRTDVRGRNLDLELAWIGTVLLRGRRADPFERRTRRQGLWAAMRLLRLRPGDDLWAADDPRPVLPGITSALGHTLERAGRRGPR